MEKFFEKDCFFKSFWWAIVKKGKELHSELHELKYKGISRSSLMRVCGIEKEKHERLNGSCFRELCPRTPIQSY